MKQLTVAVVGCGRISTAAHGPNLAADPRVGRRIFVDIVHERALALARRFGGVAYASVDHMLATERPDGAVVATDPPAHYDVTMKLLRVGVHILLEKGGKTLTQVEKITAAALARGLRVDWTFHQILGAQRAIDWIRDGGVGRVKSVEYTWLRRKPRWWLEDWVGGRVEAERPFDRLGTHGITFGLSVLGWPRGGEVKTKGTQADNRIQVRFTSTGQDLHTRFAFLPDLPVAELVFARVAGTEGLLRIEIPTTISEKRDGRPVSRRHWLARAQHPLGDWEVEPAELNRLRQSQLWVGSLPRPRGAPSTLPVHMMRGCQVQAVYDAARSSPACGGIWTPVPSRGLRSNPHG